MNISFHFSKEWSLWIIFLVTSSSLFVSILLLNDYETNHLTSFSHDQSFDKKANRITIVLYHKTPVHYIYRFLWKEGGIQQGCSVPCEYVWGKDLEDSEIQSSDAVLFFYEPWWLNQTERKEIQSKIIKNQERILISIEPSNCMLLGFGVNRTKWDYDLKAYVTRDSDIQISYFSAYTHEDFRLYTQPPPNKQEYRKELNVTAPILYLTSNCEGRRRFLVQKLMEYIPVDSYGLCFKNKEYPHINVGPVANEEEGWWKVKIELLKRYKFVLAFENLEVYDYVSEKFFQPLAFGCVPIYWGAPNIDEFIPFPHSVIKAEDFKSVEELANYIKFLDQNEKAYREYFDWKDLWKQFGTPDHWKPIESKQISTVPCRICEKVSQRKMLSANEKHIELKFKEEEYLSKLNKKKVVHPLACSPNLPRSPLYDREMETHIEKQKINAVTDQDVFIVSYPKSGNTWLRYLLSYLRVQSVEPPIVEKTILRDPTYLTQDWAKELISPRIIKTHELLPSSSDYLNWWQKRIPRILYLVRDGRDSYVSFYYFTKDLPKNLTFEEYYIDHKKYSVHGRWGTHVQSWLKGNVKWPGELTVFKYEDLITNTEETLTRIADWIGIPTTPELIKKAVEATKLERLQEIENSPKSTFVDVGNKMFRKGVVGDWKNHFTPKSTRLFQESLDGEMLMKLGYVDYLNQWDW